MCGFGDFVWPGGVFPAGFVGAGVAVGESLGDALGDGDADGERARTVFELVVVQPGFSRQALSPKLGSILAAANDYLARAGFLPLTILGSA